MYRIYGLCFFTHPDFFHNPEDSLLVAKRSAMSVPTKSGNARGALPL